MIKSLSLQNVATFDDDGIEITDLKKINFIYGTNGSGKSTITKVISNPENPDYTDCVVTWENETPIKVLTYNKDFREKNFGKGSIDGVFTLGKASKEEMEAIRVMQDELTKIKAKGEGIKDSIDQISIDKEEAEEDLKEMAWTQIYKKNETDFKEAFTGAMRKDAFKAKLLDEFQNNKTEPMSYEELKGKSKILFGKTPTALSPIPTLHFDRLIQIEAHGIWAKKIIGKSDIGISGLIEKLNLNDWVSEGKSYLQQDDTCPFCQQQTITKEFRTQLEEYFDESFTTDTALVKTLTDEYNTIASNLSTILQQIESSERSNTESKLKVDTFSALVKALSSQLTSNREFLSKKLKESSRSIALIPIKGQSDDIMKLIADANTEISKHNNIVSNYSIERNNLIKGIWRYLADENKSKITAYYKKIEALEKKATELEQKDQALQAELAEQGKKIRGVNKSATGIQASIDEINRTLKSYGFLNFEIVPSATNKNQYQIQREDGTIAESTLSEGEITFITFLYFVQLAKGGTTEDTINDERILVVDDPISSLDNNVLFVVSSLIKDIIKGIKRGSGNIKQLIVLTHNIYFHKEASYSDGQSHENDETSYWILRKNKNVSSIQGYGPKNPIHSSYELLWQDLKARDDVSGITIQNNMRRIIESYFKMLGKHGDDDLIEQFDNHQEQEICRSLIYGVNDGLRSIPGDLLIEQDDEIADKYFEVFKKIFDQTGHAAHYKMMMN